MAVAGKQRLLKAPRENLERQAGILSSGPIHAKISMANVPSCIFSHLVSQKFGVWNYRVNHYFLDLGFDGFDFGSPILPHSTWKSGQNGLRS